VNIENHDELLVYLKQSGRIEAAEQPHFTTLQGGISNRTVLVERQAGQSWVIKQALAKLRVDVDWFSDPSRIEREAAAMKYLAQLAPPGSIIPLIFLDQEHHLLAMQAVAQRHENFKSRLLTGQIERNEIEQFARLLGAIHRNAWNRRDELAEIFDNRAYFESLRLEPYYAYAAPEPDGLRDEPLPVGEWTDTGSGSLALLPYDLVRAARDSRGTLLAFMQGAYEAGARLARWDTSAFASKWCPTPGQLHELQATAAYELGRPADGAASATRR